MISPLLIVVHPGSLCGSLDFHHGEAADDIREAIINEIENWPGNVAVVDGDLSDELATDDYRDLRIAVEGCAVYRTRGQSTALGLKRAAKRMSKSLAMTPGNPVTVTGAWHDKDGTGCVSTIANSLTDLGMKVLISQNAPAAD